MTLQQKLRRSNIIMAVLFVISLSIFTLIFKSKEYMVSSITIKNSIELLIFSIVILFVLIFGMYYLPMLFVVKFTFRFPNLSINNHKEYIKYIFRNINSNETAKYLKLCVFRC